MPRFAFACLYLFVMHTLGISYGRLARFHSYSLEQSYIVHLICAKVQIVDNFSQISPSKMTFTLMWCHVSSGIFLFQNQCACFLQVFHTCVHKFRGRLLYKLDALRLTPFQAYHVCSSLIARKMESPELSIILQISTTYCKW